MILTAAAQATSHIQFSDLGLHSVALDLGFFQLKWYSLAYIAGILVGWWYLLKLLAQPGAPMARRHADDMVFYATIGIIVGGRLGYVIFYQPSLFLEPLKLLQLWEGGMSFHGGTIGVMLAILWLCRKEQLNWLRVHDYVACCVPFGLFFGRIANFVNGELWGHPTTVPWGIVHDMNDRQQLTGETFARHPSQLYEAGLEGLLVGIILWFLFWKTDARYQPGKLVGTFILGYGLSRWFVEFFREHDAQFNDTIFATPGLHMGQLLTLPMIFGGIYLIATAKKRRERVEPFAGDQTIA
ncbi:prolipoprotein diacylglyceryl transferase [Sphingomonas sp.]|uniref:prolipoprotein diacylglyceryl transferase n=1 Tax=Sphingomonas sp. TaxID=28214 RepID=UPI000BC80782|nr:prolipoprotein diacylglyceryl transferase [Sphingomonas sp.]MBA4760332.1 prolipoprotein diacylglyceryl transferase [Sphingomonas sp.]OYX50545.1 MAG: prolipoprotein diacylglyceryl transferase [Sphingomonas sp. 32-66-10]